MSKETKKDEVIIVEDFSTSAGQSTQQIVASELAKLEAKMKALLKKASANSVLLGVTVKDMDSKGGAEILDKNTKEPLFDNYGNPRKYPDKFHVTFMFQGGSLTQEVKEKHYLNLQIGKKYYASGYYGEVSSFGKTEMCPIFTDFEPLDI